MSSATPRILSGIKPTGRPHIGNYFGMMRPAIEWQDRGDAYYFIADYHAFTTVHDAKAMREYTRGVALDFLACGLDPQKATLFRQSDVPQVAELAWLLTCITPMPMLENCHAHKDYRARQAEEQKVEPAGHGLFAYPVLMAADILAYQSNIVPVGRDQKQHVEVTRDLAEKWNRLLGPTFRVPEASIRPDAAAIPGLDGQKMSKSYGNTIGIFEDEKPLRKRIMGIVTDSTPVEAPKSPEGSPILPLYRLFATPADAASMEAEFQSGGVGYGDFKKRLFGAVWEYFGPMRAKRAELESDRGYVDTVLTECGQRARSLAEETMEKVRLSAGLRQEVTSASDSP